MKRREFNTLLFSGLAASSLGIWRDGAVYAQTANGGLTSLLTPEPPTLALAMNQQTPTYIAATKIFEGLLQYDLELKPMPMLAKSWEISDDQLTYTFKLQENVKWHDGKPFTAADAVFSLDVLLREVHPRARNTMNYAESITAPDDLTLVVKLKEPFAPFLQALEAGSAPMFPKHLYEGTEFRKNEWNDKPVGTGPFMFKEWSRGSHIHFVANPDYYIEGQPSLTEIFYRIVPDGASRAVAIETGEAELSGWSDLETFDVERLSSLPHVTKTTQGYEYFSPVTWFEFNLRKAPFNDVRFRQAMAHLIDKQFIVDRILFGLGKPSHTGIASTTPFHEAGVKVFEFDVDKANAILDEMGMKKDASGKRVTFNYLVAGYGEMWTRLGEYFRQAMAAGGIEVNLVALDAAAWAQAVSNWDYDATMNNVYQFGDPALGVSRTYVSSNIRKGVMFTNTSGYENPEVDRLFAEAAVAPTAEARQKLYTEVQNIMAEEQPVIWVAENQYPTIYDNRLQDIVVTGTGVNGNFARARWS